MPAVQSKMRETLPVLRWFHALMPQQGRFFELFEAHAATLVAGSEALAELFQAGADIRAHIAEIIRPEHQADDITRAVLFVVRHVFVTPFARRSLNGLHGPRDEPSAQHNT